MRLLLTVDWEEEDSGGLSSAAVATGCQSVDNDRGSAGRYVYTGQPPEETACNGARSLLVQQIS